MTLSTMPSWLFVGGFNASLLPLDPWNTTDPMSGGTTGYDVRKRTSNLPSQVIFEQILREVACITGWECAEGPDVQATGGSRGQAGRLVHRCKYTGNLPLWCRGALPI